MRSRTPLQGRWIALGKCFYLPDIDAKNSVRGIVVMVVDLSHCIEDELRRSRQQFADLTLSFSYTPCVKAWAGSIAVSSYRPAC